LYFKYKSKYVTLKNNLYGGTKDKQRILIHPLYSKYGKSVNTIHVTAVPIELQESNTLSTLEELENSNQMIMKYSNKRRPVTSDEIVREIKRIKKLIKLYTLLGDMSMLEVFNDPDTEIITINNNTIKQANEKEMSSI